MMAFYIGVMNLSTCWLGLRAWRFPLIICLLLLAPFASAQQTLNVLASIKPLQLIAQALTQDITDTQVLLPPGVTPHDYALKPSDLKRVYASDVLIWLGSEVEPYLAKPATMYQGEQLATWQSSENSHEENHDHDHHHDGHDHLYGDPHIWFSPDQAASIARQLAGVLIAKDQQNASRYQQNLTDFLTRVSRKDVEIKAQLADQLPAYLVAHDAYSYFEEHYGLKHVAAISDTPESKPGARGLLTLRRLIAEQQIRCLFIEPQTDQRIVSILAENNALQVYSLDPMANEIGVSDTGYENFLQDTADRFSQCHW